MSDSNQSSLVLADASGLSPLEVWCPKLGSHRDQDRMGAARVINKSIEKPVLSETTYETLGSNAPAFRQYLGLSLSKPSFNHML